MNRFDQELKSHGLASLQATETTTLQVNLGKLCNQACKHCHVDAGPHQTGAEANMGIEVVEAVVDALRSGGFHTLDLTGGAPELNPHFRNLVRSARELGICVIDRCNLSVLFEPGQEDLAQFLAEQGVEISASLPHYQRDATDRQRGAGIYDQSIAGLQRLNELGYGDGQSGLRLHLVYNPVGAFLPGSQVDLERDFKRELNQLFGIRFDKLFCITNMPIRRYLEWLQRSGNEARYRQRLLDAFNPTTVEMLMCRNLVSVAPDGRLYDCDFNQMLDLPLRSSAGNIRDFDRSALDQRRIVTDEHCLGCTAGSGSSCGGELIAED